MNISSISILEGQQLIDKIFLKQMLDKKNPKDVCIDFIATEFEVFGRSNPIFSVF